jgi:transposase
METSLARDLMSDEEWAFFEQFILSVRAPNGRKPTNHRLVLDGIFWIARTGAPWRDLPEEFGKWSSVYRQFRRWTLAGLWEDIMDALNQSRSLFRARAPRKVREVSIICVKPSDMLLTPLQVWGTCCVSQVICALWTGVRLFARAAGRYGKGPARRST